MSTEEAFAAVIVAHQRIPLFDGTGGQRCTGCDSLYGETDGPNSPRHAAHIAAALLASPAMKAHEAAVLEASIPVVTHRADCPIVAAATQCACVETQLGAAVRAATTEDDVEPDPPYTCECCRPRAAATEGSDA